MLVDVSLVVEQLVAKKLFGIGGPRSQTRHSINHVADQVKSVEKNALKVLNSLISVRWKWSLVKSRAEVKYSLHLYEYIRFSKF